ncbi:MAG: DNA methyltransferase [Myxococcaceae bacterium]
MPPNATRTVHCADALPWLEERGVIEGASLVTSLPDVSELPALTLDGWRDWFVKAARRVLASCPDDGVAIFLQTDVKKEGAWVDKGYLVQKAAELQGHALLWHKIVCRKPPGTVTWGRPSYSHLLCFSRGVRVDLARCLADVLPEAGEMTWSKAMGVEACRLSCRFILEETRTRTVVDPFCGRGTVLAVANAMGLDAVGVEIARKRAKQSRSLEVR